MSRPVTRASAAAAGSREPTVDITINGDNVNVNNGDSPHSANNIYNVATPMKATIDQKLDSPIISQTEGNSNNNVDALQLIAKALQQLTCQSMMQTSSTSSPKPPTQASTHIADRAAVDDRSTMPVFTKFDNKIIKPDAFIEWKKKTTEAIDGHPRYSPLLLDVEQGWETFLKVNSKYTQDKIERFYLETQRSLWSLIVICFDTDVITSVSAEIEEENKSSPLTD
jgi:hypothetical protein